MCKPTNYYIELFLYKQYAVQYNNTFVIEMLVQQRHNGSVL